MVHQYSKFLHPLYLIGDLILLNLAFFLSYFIKFSNLDLFIFNPYFFLLVFFNIIWIFVSVLLDNHEKNRMATNWSITKKIGKALILHLAAITTILLFIKVTYFSRLHLFYSYTIFAILLLTWRLTFIYLLRLYRKKGYNLRSYIIVGFNKPGQTLYKLFNKHPEFGFSFQGYFDNYSKDDLVKGNIADIPNFVSKNGIDEIYCSIVDINKPYVKELVKFGDANLVRVKLLASTPNEGKSQKFHPLQYGDINVFNIRKEPLNNSFSIIVKRIFDIIFSSLVMICILSWLLPLIAILIKLDSKGPVFFLQKRGGKNGKHFRCIKFRTMYHKPQSEFKLATKNDSRITKVGKFLRKTSLDEFPQFINVFLGDMTVVGPRPHALQVDDTYRKIVNKYMARYFVKPGVTGLSQVKGYRGRDEDVMPFRVKLDIFYIENWSLFFDIKIIFLTVLNMIRGEENAF